MIILDKYIMTDVLFKDPNTDRQDLKMFSFIAIDVGQKGSGANKNMIFVYDPDDNRIFNTYVSDTGLQRRIRPLKSKKYKYDALKRLFYVFMDSDMKTSNDFYDPSSVRYLLNFYIKGSPY